MIRRFRLLRLSLALTLVAAGSFALFRLRLPERKILLGDVCRTPARLIAPSADPSGRVAIVFHGLGASAAIMDPLGQSLAVAGWRVYLLDLAGHGRSREPFSYANVDRCARAATQYLLCDKSIQPAKTVIVGHSLGAAAAVRVAADVPVAGTIAISPALLAVPRRAPANLLILAGQFDFGVVKREARALLRLAGGVRDVPSDFAAGRAAQFHVVSGELHGSMVLDPRVWRMVAAWAGRAVNSGQAQTIPAVVTRLPLELLLASLALICGLVLLIGPWESLLARMASLQPSRVSAGDAAAADTGAALPESGVNWRRALIVWAIASFFAVSLIALTRAPHLFHPVELADGDWAALVALVTGLVIAFLFWSRVRASLRIEPRGELVAALAGISIVVAFAFALRPEFVEASLMGERLWRWAVLAAFTWPYFLAEEVTLGPPSGASVLCRKFLAWSFGGRSFSSDINARHINGLQHLKNGDSSMELATRDTRRFALFLALRAIVWLAQAFALLVFWRWGLLLVLFAFGLGAVSIGQRLAADVLRRRGAGPVSAALLDAILAAGLLALVLPLR